MNTALPWCSLSDLEDDELDRYLNTPAESKLKDIVWTAMNQDYIEKQALKAALQPKSEVRLALHQERAQRLQQVHPWADTKGVNIFLVVFKVHVVACVSEASAIHMGSNLKLNDHAGQGRERTPGWKGSKTAQRTAQGEQDQAAG